MLTDMTNTYENKMIKNQETKLEKPIEKDQIENQCVSQLLEDQDDEQSRTSEIQKSICFQENEIQRLSQAFADKYYYEMKYEQYQNLLAQQQCTISKLLNEKKEIQEKYDQIRQSQLNQNNNNEFENKCSQLEQQLQEQTILNEDLEQQNQIYEKQLDEYKRLFQKLTKEQELLSQSYQEFKLQTALNEQEQKQLIQQLQNESKTVRKSELFEFQKQMNEIKEQNNYLFEQLSEKEQAIEKHFQVQISNIVERLNQEKEQIIEELESQLNNKDENIHSLEMQLNDLSNQAQILYSENLQLQSQMDLLNQNYQEDIQHQANMLSQQVAEYKVIINNLENQLFLMNAEIQRRGRSASKENYVGYRKQKQSCGEMTFSNITPSAKQFQQLN